MPRVLAGCIATYTPPFGRAWLNLVVWKNPTILIWSGNSLKTYKLHLIRHGLTQGNMDGIYMGGGLDQPLCGAGRRQLEDLRDRFAYPRVGLLYSSPMLRAVQSAEILYPDVLERYVLEDLRECRFGVFENRRVEELMENEDFRKWLDPKSDFVPEGGESGREFASRSARALLGMLEHMAKAGIHEAACVTHGGVIMSMLGQLALPRRPGSQWMADNGTGYTVQADAGMIMRDQLVEAVDVVPHGYLDEQQPDE